MRLACCLALMCCGSEHPVTTPAHNVKPAGTAAALALRADAALDEPLDYERPFAAKSRDRSEPTKLLLDACEAGDAPSCWKGFAIAPAADQPRLLDLVASNCRGGDLRSCQALPADDTTLRRFAKLPGAEGRARVCAEHEAACDVAALRTECARGFAQSCKLASMSDPPPNDWDALVTRASELAKQACEHDLPQECSDPSPRHEWSADFTLEAARRRCRFFRTSCRSLAALYDERQQPEQARDALERACEWSERGDDACLRLGIAYLDRRYVEPVPRRGQALVDHACRELASVTKAEAVAERYPDCKRATK